MSDIGAPLDSDYTIRQEARLMEALKWWEKKRLLFNLVVGAVGAIATIIFANSFGLFDVIGSIQWGIVANILYTVGFMVEALSVHYLKEKLNLAPARPVFFLLGTLAYCLVSFLFAMMYFSYISPVMVMP